MILHIPHSSTDTLYYDINNKERELLRMTDHFTDDLYQCENSQRVVFGAWQEHQGLGAPASQAHLAELPRLPLLYILNSLLPQSAVRFSFIYLCYVLGGISTCLFSRHACF